MLLFASTLLSRMFATSLHFMDHQAKKTRLHDWISNTHLNLNSNCAEVVALSPYFAAAVRLSDSSALLSGFFPDLLPFLDAVSSQDMASDREVNITMILQANLLSR